MIDRINRTDRIDKKEFARMISGAAASIRSQHALLSELDSAAGDGDHGVTMLRTMDQLEKTMAAEEPAELRTVFKDAGWAVLGVDGGASSALLGTFFLGMADTPAAGASLDCRELSGTFAAGLQALRRQTKAQPGDKTMMDALVPAVEALRAAAEAGKNVNAALQDAARAARAGAEATSQLIARYGRARLLGEKTRGHADPGATSIALIFEGFCNGLAEPKGEVNNA